MNANAFPPTELVTRYDGAASGWHAHSERLGFLKAYRAALAQLELPRGAQVLDAGVGTGALSLALAERDAKIQVTSVDLSPVMLSEAARQFRLANISARLLQGDVRSLCLENRSCDAVLCAHVLEHLTNPRDALLEFHRVLKFGAPLFLSITRKGLLGAYIAYRWGVKPYRAAEVQRLVEAAGFQEVRLLEFEGELPRRLSVAVVATKGAE